MAEVIYAGDAGIFKTCTKCGETKPSSGFRHASNGAAGLRGECRTCGYAHKKKWREDNPDWEAGWRAENRDKVNEASARWRAKNPEAAKLVYSNWRARNLDECLERSRVYRDENRERLRERERLLRLENPELFREKSRRSGAKRRRDPKFRVDVSMSRSMNFDIRRGSKGGRPWESLVGYTLADLTKHLESLFTEGMSWENYGLHGWHIDHKIPRSAFNYTTPEHHDFKRCWALSNLQPLWAFDNLSKKDKLEAPFQPSLAL